jgi:uncharacterized RDD family membrane protein YckC
MYILVINGKPEGPFTLDELKARVIKPGDFVKTKDMLDYKEAHEVAELCELFHFKRQITEPQYFAGLDQRLLAGALDLFFVSGFYIILGFAAVLFIPDQENRVIVGVSLVVLIPLTDLIYHVIMECSDRQATYGKQILKIKVCDEEGKRIDAGRAIARNFCKFFSTLTLFIGYLISFFNRRQQCLHDMIAGTLVVKDRLF